MCSEIATTPKMQPRTPLSWRFTSCQDCVAAPSTVTGCLRSLAVRRFDVRNADANLCRSIAPSRNGRLDEPSRHLNRAAQSLPMQERLVVTLRYFNGHSVQQIADLTGRPLGPVTKQLSRAYTRLRAMLRDRGDA